MFFKLINNAWNKLDDILKSDFKKTEYYDIENNITHRF